MVRIPQLRDRTRPRGTTPLRARRRRNAAAAAALAGVMVVGVAVPAEARVLSSQVLSHNLGTTGVQATLGDSSTYMSWAQVWHFDAINFNSYCGAQAKITGTLSSGAGYTKTFGYQAGCWLVQVEEGMAPKKYFKAGSRFYGQAYHDGAWATDRAYIRP